MFSDKYETITSILEMNNSRFLDLLEIMICSDVFSDLWNKLKHGYNKHKLNRKIRHMYIYVWAQLFKA